MDDDLDLEILSYKEFRNRQTLQAWRERQRTHEGDQSTERRSEDIEDPGSGEDIARHRNGNDQNQRPASDTRADRAGCRAAS